MSKNLEIESKTLLDEETYKKMRDAFTAKSDFIQKNYYFDTPDFDLKNSDASLRIRILVDHAEQTIKVKETNPKENKYSERIEINDLLSVAQAEQMTQSAEQMTQSAYEGTFFLFGGDVGDYLQKYYSNEAIHSLKLISWSQTRRILATGPENCELTLDLTEFPDGYYDFELEIENDDPATIKKVLAELEKQFNFKVNKENTNQSKVQRAWEHKK